MSFILLLFIFGYIVGSIVTAVVCHPSKSFDEGYEAAKKSFTNHDEWFNNGWEAAKVYYKKRIFETALEMHRHQELMEEAEKKREEAKEDDQT